MEAARSRRLLNDYDFGDYDFGVAVAGSDESDHWGRIWHHDDHDDRDAGVDGGVHRRPLESLYQGRSAGVGCLDPNLQSVHVGKDCRQAGWWVLMLMIPFVNIVFGILLAIDIAKAFGQSAAFGVVLLFLLGGIGYLVLGFGNYSYLGVSLPSGSSGTVPARA